MITLGINAFHGDAAACIFKEKKLIAAAEEERFSRIKHTAGFPIEAIKYCLNTCKIDISDVDYVTVNRNPKQKILPKVIYAAKNIFNSKFLFNRFKNLKKINSIKDDLEKYLNKKCNAEVYLIDHHTSHIASSIYFSPYERTNFISVDGFGDFTSTVTGHYDGNKINKFNEVLFPHSLGLFYTALTQYLGFLKYGDEYKVMGLAPYGEPKYFDKIRSMIIDTKNSFKLDLKYFKHHTGDVEMTWLYGEPKIGKVYSDDLIKLLGPERNQDDEVKKIHMDIASSTQKVYEEVLFRLINKLYYINPSDSLCISGGCGMNSVANGKIIKNSKYKNIFIPSAPGDSGGSVGSASYLINKKYNERIKFNNDPYLGPEYKDEDISNELKKRSDIINLKNVKISKFNDIKVLLKKTAANISDGKIVGFFNGRMEWGPRALGNRSILADPRNPKMREVLNLKIKRREEFRPFAPSILESHVSNWFELNDEVPFMSKVYQIKKEKRNLIPAVTHVDGSGRLQTVSKELNNNYYYLIDYFNQLTNVPILLNTSFNENEPIVCKPSEALDCFLRTNMDILVLQNYFLERKE